MQQAKVDSFKILVPISICKVLEENFLKSFVHVYIESGEVETDVSGKEIQFKNTAITRVINGITCRFRHTIRCNRRVKGKFDGSGGSGEEYFEILVNAKMLGENYFTGINLTTIKQIYDYIISLQVVWFNYEEFLISESIIFNDIDVCVDLNFNDDSYNSFLKIMREQTILEKKALIKSYTGQGMEFNSRNEAKPSNPFIKIYNKTKELRENSTEFYTKYLPQLSFDSIIGRLEVTIKNSKTKDAFKINHLKTVKDFLQYIELNGMELIKQFFNKYLTKMRQDRVIIKDDSKLLPYEHITISLILNCLKLGQSKEQTMFNVLSTVIDKSKRRNIKNNLDKAFNHIKNLEGGNDLLNEMKEKNKDLDLALRVVGLYDEI